MFKSPDSRLIDEQAALPAYASRPASADRVPPATPRGCLGWLWRLLRLLSRIIGSARIESPPDGEEGRVKVLLPPPPGVYGYATLFTPAPEVLQRSHWALDGYREEYEEPYPNERPYPWRMVTARHTGLPALLRGFLDEQEPFDAPGYADEIASEWLFQNLRPQALFGLSPSEARQRLKRQREEIDASQMQVKRGHDKKLVHVRYQQWHQDWPIFGGQVIVHLASRDRRTSVTSSYFPLDATMDFVPEIDRATAIALAQQALAGYVDEREAIGLYRSVLYPRLEVPETGQPSAEQWRPIHSRMAGTMVEDLAAFSETHDHVFSDLEELAASGLPATLDQLHPLPKSLDYRLDELGLTAWHADAVPYAGSDLFIFPFAGDYHLAYQVELSSPDYSQTWRVFVDAETGDVLGRPENCIFHVHYYATAGDVLDKKRSQKKLELNPCRDFMLVGLYKKNAPPGQDPKPNWSHNQTSGSNFEATNIAIHAKKVYDHFVDVCKVDASRLQSYEHDGQVVTPGLRVRVAKSDTHLDMGFNNAAGLHPKLITFQTDQRNGLIVNGKKAHNPAYDPEVVYHEVTHGLMWLLNRHPFDQPITSVPFGRALVEGYANYFGRSLAAASDTLSDPDQFLWARAAYRKAYWNNRWALSRDEWVVGKDLLPAPNLYPHQKTEGLPVYDVGMIWARALWDLRSILRPDTVDRLALEAYEYLHGWVANFELAAEGLLDAAAKTDIPEFDQAGRQAFALRGILAGQSIQALARADDVLLDGGQKGTILLAGADAGLMRSTDDGQNWEDWGDLPGRQTLTDVVDLAVEDKTFYAATETGVYWRASDGDEWSPVGEWPVDQTPFSLIAAQGKLYAGTGRGVWRFDASDDGEGWAIFNNPDHTAFEGLALDLAFASVPSLDADVLYTASFSAVHYRDVDPRGWLNKIVDDAAVVAAAAQGDSAYLGTLAHGIWRLRIGNNNELTKVASLADLKNGAVLTLAFRDNEVVAGTTAGLYVGTPDTGNPWSWKLLDGIPLKAKAKVTVVLPVGNDVLASTATHGLWRWDGKQWEKVEGVEKLLGKS